MTSQVFCKKKQMEMCELRMQKPYEPWAFMELWETMGTREALEYHFDNLIFSSTPGGS